MEFLSECQKMLNLRFLRKQGKIPREKGEEVILLELIQNIADDLWGHLILKVTQKPILGDKRYKRELVNIILFANDSF
jgi:hypothetical protein